MKKIQNTRGYWGELEVENILRTPLEIGFVCKDSRESKEDRIEIFQNGEPRPAQAFAREYTMEPTMKLAPRLQCTELVCEEQGMEGQIADSNAQQETFHLAHVLQQDEQYQQKESMSIIFPTVPLSGREIGELPPTIKLQPSQADVSTIRLQPPQSELSTMRLQPSVNQSSQYEHINPNESRSALPKICGHREVYGMEYPLDLRTMYRLLQQQMYLQCGLMGLLLAILLLLWIRL